MATGNVIGDGAFVIELDRFHGPLDLLLHLIREQDIDIFDIPIARITAQFLEAIAGVESLGLDRAGDFLEMAATLIRIKAQMLLPRHSEEGTEFEDPRAGLVQRLLEYELFREIARLLEAAEAERAAHYPRGYVPRLQPSAAEQPLELGIDELIEAAKQVGERSAAPPDHQVTRRVVTIEEKISLILGTLSRMARVEFRALVSAADPLHRVVTLLASLELARQRRLAMRQREPFAPLWLYRTREKRSDENGTDH